MSHLHYIYSHHLYIHTTHLPPNDVTLMPFVFALNGQCILSLSVSLPPSIEHISGEMLTVDVFCCPDEKTILTIPTSFELSTKLNLSFK